MPVETLDALSLVGFMGREQAVRHLCLGTVSAAPVAGGRRGAFGRSTAGPLKPARLASTLPGVGRFRSGN